MKNLAKRTLSLLLCAALILTGIPFMGSLRAEAAWEGYAPNKLILDKTALLEDNGTYTVTMEAFSTGTVSKSTTPLDIVLVLDQSNSMSYSLPSDSKESDDWTSVQGRKYGTLAEDENLYYSVDGVYYPATVTQTGGTKCATYKRDGKMWFTRQEYTSTLTIGAESKELEHYHIPYYQITYTRKRYYDNSYNYYYAYVDDSGTIVTDYIPVEDEEEAMDALAEYHAQTYPEYIFDYIDYSAATSYMPVNDFIYADVTYSFTYEDNGVTKTFHEDVVANSDTSSKVEGLYIYTRMTALQKAVNSFLEELQKNAVDNDVSHRIAVVGFAGGTTVTEGNKNYNEYEKTEYEGTELLSTPSVVSYKVADEDDYQAAMVNVNDNGSLNAVLSNAVSELTPTGYTFLNYGLAMANSILEARTETTYSLPDGTKAERKSVVIVFTDGIPGKYLNVFNDNTPLHQIPVANRAIKEADAIKAGGTEIYTIGLIEGADPKADYNFTPSTDANNVTSYETVTQATNAYLHFLSSDYEQAVDMEEPDRETIVNKGYFHSAQDAEQLNEVFAKLSSTIGGSAFSMTGDAALYDKFTPGFDLPAGIEESPEAHITVQVADYLGGGKWSEPYENPFLSLSADLEDRSICVQGFDYSYNYVTEEIDERGIRGKKLIVTVRNVTANDAAITEGNYPTNEANSGVYTDATLQQNVEYFEPPQELLQGESYVLDGSEKMTIEPSDIGISVPGHISTDGMLYFDPDAPVVGSDNQGTLEIIDGKLVYTPSAATWIDVFYVFGTDANGNNVWARLEIRSTAANTLYLDKDAVLEDDGTYTVTLDAFTTGEVKAHSAPMDIVLVVDQSGSMAEELTDVTADFEQIASATKVTGQSFGDLESYQKLYYVKDGEAHPAKVTRTGGTKQPTYYDQSGSLYTGNYEVSQTVTLRNSTQDVGTYALSYEHIPSMQKNFVLKVKSSTYAYYDVATNTAVTSWYTTTDAALDALIAYRDENYKKSTIYGAPTETGGIYISSLAFLTPVQGYVWKNATYQVSYTPAGKYPITIGSYSTDSFAKCDIDNLYIYTRNDAIKSSVLDFMESIWEDADMYGLDHRISVVGFASGTDISGTEYKEYDDVQWKNTELLGLGEPISYPNITTANYQAALQTVNDGGSLNPNLLGAIDHLDPSGGTYTNYGLEMAKNILNARPEDERTYVKPDGTLGERKSIVILFTDGYPGSNRGVTAETMEVSFTDQTPEGAIPVANRTITVADQIKADGARIYAVAMIDGIDPNADYNFTKRSSEDSSYQLYYTATKAANAYLHFLSSDYEQAVSMETPDRSTVVNKGFVFSAADSDKLDDAFKSIMENVGVTTQELDENAVLYDVFTTGFDLPADFAENIGDYVSVYTSDYLGNGAWAERQEVSINAPDGTGIQVTAASDGEALAEGGTKTNAIQVTGYDYAEHCVTEAKDDHEASGQKLIVVIRKVEANDAAITEADYATNKNSSAIYLDATLNDVTKYFPIPDELLQKETYLVTNSEPLTIDPTDVGIANPVHLDTDGMNEFDPILPTTAITEQGTVEIVDGKIVFTPPQGEWTVTALYIFGTDENGENVWAKIFIQPPYYASYVIDYAKPITVDASDFGLAQALHLDAAGQNDFEAAVTSIEATYGTVSVADGKLSYTPKTAAWGGYDTFYVYGIGEEGNEAWATVTVMPANNVFFEDDFGVTYSDNWTAVGTARNNTETPNNPIHGYIESKEAEASYSDGTAHYTQTHGATASFEFTGTGVDVYCRTDVNCGITIALLTRAGETAAIRYLNVDNESVSDGGTGYYQIPTVFFHGLAYGTYTVKIIVTSDNGTDGYYLDGYRVYNPLAEAQNDAVVQQAYGVELNASFETVRKLLLDAGTLAADGMADGYVFLDKVLVNGKEGYQQAVESNAVAAYEAVGPKNEVYLAKGQSIVFKMEVVDGASCFVGLKTPNGKTGKAEYTFGESKKSAELAGSSDQYYEIQPNADGYVMVTNTGDDMIAVTKIRSTLPASQGFGLRKVSVRHLIAYANGFDAAEVGEDIEPIAQSYTIANTQLAPAPKPVELPSATLKPKQDLSKFSWVKKPAPTVLTRARIKL